MAYWRMHNRSSRLISLIALLALLAGCVPLDARRDLSRDLIQGDSSDCIGFAGHDRLARIAAFAHENSRDGQPVDQPRSQAIRADILSLNDYQAHLSGKVQFLLDATLGFISIEQNDVVKTLTVVSVVGVPPVVIAGIYGMNFHHMPELDWTFGYPISIGLMIASALLPLAWFKWRGWL